MWDLMGQILGVAIGLSFVYLLLSVMVSAAVEGVIGYWLSLRSRLLKASVESMLNALGQSDAANTVRPVANELLDHPAVRGLSRSSSWFTRQSLAYLPSREFATALVDVVCPPTATSPRDMSQVLASLQRLTGNPALQSYLIGLAQESGVDLDKFRERLAHWFDATQEQVSALYRSYSGFALMFIALLAASIFNVDGTQSRSRFAASC